jgi:hypothetical protein
VRTFVSSAISTPFPYASSVSAPFSQQKAGGSFTPGVL